jgi:hypothetical protein
MDNSFLPRRAPHTLSQRHPAALPTEAIRTAADNHDGDNLRSSSRGTIARAAAAAAHGHRDKRDDRGARAESTLANRLQPPFFSPFTPTRLLL